MLRPETAGESKELGEEGGGRANRIASHLFSSKKKKKKKFRSRSSAGGEGEEREREREIRFSRLSSFITLRG